MTERLDTRYAIRLIQVRYANTFGFKDFQKMVNPPKPPERPKPTKADFRTQFQDNSDNVLKKLTSLQTTCHVQENLPLMEPDEVFPSVDKDSCSVDVNASFSSDPLLSANLSA